MSNLERGYVIGDPIPVEFYNLTNEIIPAFAVMQIAAMTKKRGRFIYAVEKPDGVTTGQREFLINGPIEVEPEEFGTGADAVQPVLAKMNEGEDSPVIFGEYGPEEDSWFLSSTKTGFVSQCSGQNIASEGISNDPLTVMVKRVSGSGGGCSGQNEQQGLFIIGNPTGGTFTLTVGALTTSALDYDATAEDIQAAIEALDGYTSGDITVSGGPANEAALVLTWGGELAETAPGIITPNWGLLEGFGVGIVVTRFQAGRAG